MADDDTGRTVQLLNEDIAQCRDEGPEERMEELRSLSKVLTGDLSTDVKVFSALSNDTRYQIIRLLAAADGELCVCELQPLLDVSDSAVSHAVSKLHDAGLVERRKEGRWRHYKTTDEVEQLLETLDSLQGRSGDES